MVTKSWNVRDQNTESLERLLAKKYKEINGNYRMLKKVSDIEDAKMLIDEIWRMKKWADDIELELMKRRANDEETI